MHEAAIAAPLLRLVLEEAARHAAVAGKLKVTGVKVRAGLLMSIEERSLAGIFALMAEGTEAEGARLELEIQPMSGGCPDCGARVEISSRDFHCPVCGGENVDWKGGNELLVSSVTVEQERRFA